MVKVQILDPEEEDSLLPQYVEDSHLLFVQALAPLAPLDYGVNIGGIICDLDEDRILVNFELLWHRDNWVVAPIPDWPRTARAARLQFAQEAVDQNFYDVAERVTTNPERTRVMVQFDHPQGSAEWFALSEHCLAWVEQDRLLGFLIALEPEPGRNG